MSWDRDGGSFPDDLFELVTAQSVTGDFSYDQKVAWQEEWKWKAPGESATCDDVDRHNGRYTFTVKATAGGKQYEEHESLDMEVQCE